MTKLKAGAAVLLAGLAGTAHAESVYDCWIGNVGNQNTTHFIRCIVDRDAVEAGVQIVAEGYEAVLDLIHRQLHSGQVGEAENTLRTNLERLRSGDYASIPVYSYPSEWSWEELRPHKLVQGALCRGGGCQAIFFRK